MNVTDECKRNGVSTAKWYAHPVSLRWLSRAFAMSTLAYHFHSSGQKPTQKQVSQLVHCFAYQLKCQCYKEVLLLAATSKILQLPPTSPRYATCPICVLQIHLTHCLAEPTSNILCTTSGAWLAFQPRHLPHWW